MGCSVPASLVSFHAAYHELFSSDAVVLCPKHVAMCTLLSSQRGILSSIFSLDLH